MAKQQQQPTQDDPTTLSPPSFLTGDLLSRLTFQSKILASINDVVIGTDEHFTITFWNPAAERLFGWTQDEVMGKRAAEVLRTEFSDTNRAESIRALTQSGHWVGEVTQYARDSTALIFEANIMTLHKPDGSFAGHVSANRDITRRKHAEMALHESEARFRSLTERLPDAVYTLDLTNQHVTFFNHDSFLGYTRTNLMSSGSILGAVHAEDAPEVLVQWQKIMRGEMPRTLNYRLRNSVGTWEWIESRITIAARHADETPREIMVILTIITERKQAEEELHRAKEAVEAANRELQEALTREAYMANTDELTSINNRRHFFELARQVFAVAQRYNHALSVILFDIDHFKLVNDTYGHQCGDRVLQMLAQSTQQLLRGSDVLARYGGEEFAILLPNSNATQAHYVAERLRKSIEALDVIYEDHSLSITVSCGIAEILPQDDNLDQIIQRADQALYDAKHAGRNSIKLFTPNIQI